jgi:predicted TIM-barrel fold metal-dependent hydrolase
MKHGLKGVIEVADILLSQFRPKSELVVPEHEVIRPKLPVIDFHAHLWQVTERDIVNISSEMEKYGIAGLVNLTGLSREGLNEMLSQTNRREKKIITFSSVDVQKLDEPDFPEYVEETVKYAYSNGVRGLKFFKSLSLGVKDSKGNYIPADTPRLKPIWTAAARLNIPVLIHIADPIAFFRPIGPENERIEELNQYPEWSFTQEGMFSFDELMEQQENLIAQNPETTFVIAHVGSASENLGFVAENLDKYPNMYVDIAARISELGRQPYTSKKFFTDYQDRILFGTDIDSGTLNGKGNELYPYYFRFLETMDEYFDYYPNPVQGRWKIYGVGLPDDVLEKVYYKNAVKLVPEFADCINL